MDTSANPAPSLFRHGVQIGVFGFVLVIKIAVIREVRMSLYTRSLYLLQSERENRTRVKRCMARENRERIGLSLFFACVVGKNPKTPPPSKLSPVADDAIT